MSASDYIAEVLLVVFAYGVVYIIGLYAAHLAFKGRADVNRSKLLVLGCLAPLIVYLPTTLMIKNIIDPYVALGLFVLVVLMSVYVIKRLSTDQSYTYKNAFVLLISIFWRFALIAAAVGAVVKLITFGIIYVLS
jgi:hypothetical protein